MNNEKKMSELNIEKALKLSFQHRRLKNITARGLLNENMSIKIIGKKKNMKKTKNLKRNKTIIQHEDKIGRKIIEIINNIDIYCRVCKEEISEDRRNAIFLPKNIKCLVTCCREHNDIYIHAKDHERKKLYPKVTKEEHEKYMKDKEEKEEH